MRNYVSMFKEMSVSDMHGRLAALGCKLHDNIKNTRLRKSYTPLVLRDSNEY